MLTFNPNQRPNCKQLLKNKWFDDIRNNLMEQCAPYKLNLKLDQEGCFDYENGNDNLPAEMLLQKLEQEMKAFYLSQMQK